jgi:O-succinylbenzoic acid--CoA ligase
MRVPEHAAAGPGELVAIDLAPGEAWLEIVGDLWWRGVAFLPLDVRLGRHERAALLDRAQPGAVLDALGETAFPGRPVAPGVAVLVATSGTAGVPRLVELSRSAVQEAVQVSAVALGADESTPWIACLTPAHVGGLLVLLRGAILGAPVIVHDGFDPVRVAQSAEGGAFVSLVPAMVRRMLEADVELAGLSMLVGGGSMDPADAETARARGARVVTTYGMTETCGGVVYDGHPLPGTQVRLDPDGAIELRGSTLMQGYRADPGATGSAFTTDGWYRTGDLGSIAPDGRLEVHGRTDDLIRTGGEKVWPEEVERALSDHPKVRDVAVAGRAHPDWGQEVVAYVVPALLEDPPQVRELREWLADRLAGFKAPREVLLVPEIARTTSGKIRRNALT